MTTMSGPFPMSVNAGSFVNSRPTGEIAGSEGYLWYDGDRLGDGATGTVYVGREKTTGHLCAIKTFNAQARKRSKTVQNREFDILSKLRHVNIVKILAIEDELQVDSRVLVMELCTGGSLFSILEHPANRFGLNEAEFLLVVEHVSNGMKHLRDNGIIHRDLKPGNIMRYVTESGESIYKLVDFGAARELDDEEVFQSLYGTEEYLLPDMYESAVLDKQRARQFGAQCDLWSLGVTFYHAATGSLPFRPFGGRKNRHTMHLITTSKESGVISGVQKHEGGKIIWSTTLPSTCQLSLGMKEMIRELLAGMLEPDATKMLKFDQFFQMVHSIVTKIPVYVFNVASGDLLRIYKYNNPMNSMGARASSSSSSDCHSLPSMSLIVVNLQDAIASQTDISPKDQILIYDGVSLDVGLGIQEEERGGGESGDGGGDRLMRSGGKSLADSFSEFITEDLLRNTQPDNPIFVLPRSTECMRLRDPVVPEFEPYCVEVDYPNDYRMAKQYCSVMYSISRQISACANVQAMLTFVRKIMSRSLKSALNKLADFKSTFRGRLETLKTTIHLAKTSKMAFASLCDASLDIQPQVDQVTTDLHSIEGDYIKIMELWGSFREKAKEAANHIPVDDRPPKVTCAGHLDPPCTNTISAFIEETTRVMNDFMDDKKNAQHEELPHNTEQIHKYDKYRLNGLRQNALSKAESHCFFNTREAHGQFVGWYKMALELMIVLERISPKKSKLDVDASLLAGRLSHFHIKLDHIHKHVLKSAAAFVTNGNSSSEEKRKRKVAQLMEKLTKDAERTSVAVGESNDMLLNMTEELKALEVVDNTSAAALNIGGADSFRSQSDYYYSGSTLESLHCK